MEIVSGKWRLRTGTEKYNHIDNMPLEKIGRIYAEWIRIFEENAIIPHLKGESSFEKTVQNRQ